MWIHWVLSGWSDRIGCLFLALWSIRQCSYPRNSKTHSSAVKFWLPSRAVPNTMIVRHYLTFSVFLLWICALYFCPTQLALCSLLGSGGRAHPNTMCSRHTRLLSPVQILQIRCIMFLKHQRYIIFPEAGQGRISMKLNATGIIHFITSGHVC